MKNHEKERWELNPDANMWDIVLAYSLQVMEDINKERLGDRDHREDPWDCVQRLSKTRWPRLPRIADVSVHLALGVIEMVLGAYATGKEAYTEMKAASERVLMRGAIARERQAEKHQQKRNAAKRAFFDELRAKRNGDG